MHPTKWYMNKLQRYFDEHYGEYGDTAGWLVNPANNIWQFVIVDLDIKVTLICDEVGLVFEKREPLE